MLPSTAGPKRPPGPGSPAACAAITPRHSVNHASDGMHAGAPSVEERLARLESTLSPDGTVRCRGILIMDAHGVARIIASVSDSGEAMLEWLDSGRVRRVMVAARADGSAGILLGDAEARPRLALGTNARGEANVTCADAEGRPRLTLGTAPDGAALTLADDRGTARITMRSANGDAVLTFADRGGGTRMSAGTFADGTVAAPTRP